MRTDRYDMVVVGAGIAGLTAAALAAEHGERVAQISVGAGTFVLGSGTIATDEMAALEQEPGFAQAIEFFRTLVTAAGVAYSGDAHHSMLLPTLLGGFDVLQLAPHTVANAALQQAAATRVVGLRGLTGFDAEFLAERFQLEASRHCSAAHYDAVTVPLPAPLGMPVTTLRVAQAFDRDAAFRTQLAAALRAAKGDAERILLPAVLGITSENAVRSAFAAQVGCTLGELPTLPPSIPGLRLASHLQNHLRARGVTFLEGYPAERVAIANGVCTAVEIASPGRGFRVAGEHFVLATSTGMHALLGNTTQLDAQQRPLNPQGIPVAENLFAACAAAERSPALRGLAVRILAGHRAALQALAARRAYAAESL